jgi:polyhydroxybutyrate depolymerase
MERTLITTSGAERTYLLRLPAGYEEGTPADVVFNFHGATSNAVSQFVYGDFRTLADRDGVILVTPDANKVFVDQDHDLAKYWNHAWEANLRIRDYDVDFILELVELIRSEYCTRDFHAAGMSAGGDMVSALECLADSPFKAFAPVTYRYYNETECADAPPRPLISFQGDQDAVVPITGSGKPWFDPPMAEIMQKWAEHNGCDPERLEKRVSDEVVHYWWAGCDASTEWYLIEGGGHTWPGAAALPVLGKTTDDISASDLIWDLFFGSAEAAPAP